MTAGIERWAAGLIALYPVLINALAAFVAQLVSTHGADFSKVANQYMFKTYLFKSRGNNLKIEDLEKNLNTPAKVIELARVLELASIPERNN